MSRLFFCILIILCLQKSFAQGYKIEIKIKGWESKDLTLAYYFEDKQFVVQTQKTDAKGSTVFQGTEKLPGGIYLIILPSRNYFDILLTDNQTFSIKSDTTDITNHIKITGSDENTYFYNYQKELSKLNVKKKKLDAELRIHAANADSSRTITTNLENVDKEIKDAWKDEVKIHPQTFLAKLLKAMNESDDEKTPTGESFYDHIDLSDSKFIRTPILQKIVRMQIAKTVNGEIGTIIKENDRLIEKSMANNKVFEYVLNYLINFYDTFQKCGMNEVFVHLAETYYFSGKVNWVDSAGLSALHKRVKILKANFAGQTAIDLKMETPTGEFVSLLGVDAKYTLLFFWQTGCGHCKEASEKLKKFYEELKKDYSIEVFAVYIKGNKPEWTEHINKNDFDWINVYDPNNATDFREYYNVFSTPILYLIDDKKTIVAKRLGEAPISELLNQLMLQKEKFKR